LLVDVHTALLEQRVKLSIEAYEELFNDKLDTTIDGTFDDDTLFSISEIQHTIRSYRTK
jgi:hydroxymethylglutaryl-CoA synthase